MGGHRYTPHIHAHACIYTFPMHLNTYRHAHVIFYLLDIAINISPERCIEKEFKVYILKITQCH